MPLPVAVDRAVRGISGAVPGEVSPVAWRAGMAAFALAACAAGRGGQFLLLGVAMTMFWRGLLPGAGGWGVVRRRGVIAVAAAAVAAVCAGLLPGAGAARAGAAGATGVSWGRAEGLRGVPAISGSRGRDQDVRFTSVSCWSANNCAAGGYYHQRCGVVSVRGDRAERPVEQGGGSAWDSGAVYRR